jgi:hypothetical protein
MAIQEASSGFPRPPALHFIFHFRRRSAIRRGPK